MTPKEKAEELVKKYLRTYPIGINPTVTISYTTNEAKQCALIAVEEMLGEYQSMSDSESIIMINYEFKFVVHQLVYWMEVKQEIEKL